MSPFWKNVNEEMQYLGMNLKTLSALTGIPYTTITNGRNREDSIPSADVALKISMALNKPLEYLLGTETIKLPASKNQKDEITPAQKNRLFQKYRQLIFSLEKCSEKVQTSFTRMAQTLAEESAD